MPNFPDMIHLNLVEVFEALATHYYKRYTLIRLLYLFQNKLYENLIN